MSKLRKKCRWVRGEDKTLSTYAETVKISRVRCAIAIVIGWVVASGFVQPARLAFRWVAIRFARVERALPRGAPWSA